MLLYTNIGCLTVDTSQPNVGLAFSMLVWSESKNWYLKLMPLFEKQKLFAQCGVDANLLYLRVISD